MTFVGCENCRYFLTEPTILERALPGLSSLSSAYASVRSSDGLCTMHDRYVSSGSRCARHAAHQA